jgi:hypothetical protein
LSRVGERQLRWVGKVVHFCILCRPGPLRVQLRTYTVRFCTLGSPSRRMMQKRTGPLLTMPKFEPCKAFHVFLPGETTSGRGP